MSSPPCLTEGKRYHVFISYATEMGDKQIAYQLQSELTALSYQCCIHEIEFKAGRLIQENIDKSLKKSLKTVIILSENFKKSFWCHVEMNEIVQLHAENKGFPPIILKLDSCEVPEALRPYTYLSLQAGLENRMTSIVEAINNLDKTDIRGTFLNIPFVPLPCINYNQDIKHSPCIWPHVCGKHILSDYPCDGGCNRCHLINQESLEKLQKCGFPVERSSSEYLLKLYKEKCKKWLRDLPSKSVAGPCNYYNTNGCFLNEGECPFTHICNDWFIGKCWNKMCSFSHDICNSQTEPLLKRFGINVDHPDDIILWQYREKCPNYREPILSPRGSVSFNFQFKFTEYFKLMGKCIVYSLSAWHKYR